MNIKNSSLLKPFKKVKFKDTIRFYIWIILYVVFFLSVYFSYRELYIQTLHYRGSEAATEISDNFDEYLVNVDTALKACSSTIEYMMHLGKPADEIQEYLAYETDKLGITSKTGKRAIFGFFNGTYISGVEWHPNSDYNPPIEYGTQRLLRIMENMLLPGHILT